MTSEKLDISVSKCLKYSKSQILREIDETDAWLLGVLYQSPQEALVKKTHCEICGYQGSSCNLELDHVAGRKHDYRTITACKIDGRYGCHSKRTQRQKTWGPDWLIGDQPQEVRDRFLLLGLRDILLLKAELTGNYYCRIVADELIEEIYKRSKI